MVAEVREEVNVDGAPNCNDPGGEFDHSGSNEGVYCLSACIFECFHIFILTNQDHNVGP